MDVVEIMKTSSSMSTSSANEKLETIQVVEDKPSVLPNNSELPASAEPPVPSLVVEDNSSTDPTSPPVPGSSSTVPKQFQEDDDDEAKLKYRSFKSFDTVEDFSDHHYKSYSVTQSKQTSQKWAKAIQQDWRLLENDLPDTIFARAYEERMDLLRAVIVGAAGTPYHDGLFFFDIHYPSEYPDTPPLVNYHAHNLGLNPNLYSNGYVCLSLLNTWKGSPEEHWTPGQSTMLQVLLSIQALVLNEKPYFNEPGYSYSAGTVHGENIAQEYNESTFILSCKTMQYTLKNPPKHFEDYVLGHFRLRANTILAACKAYIEGAQIGSVIPEVQDDDESQKNGPSEKEGVEGLHDMNGGQKSGSSMHFKRAHFKREVGTMIGSLVPAFVSKGAKNCEQFICLGDQAVADESQAQFQPYDYSPPHYYSSDEYCPPYSPEQAQFPPFSHPRPLFQPSAPSPVLAQFQPLAHSAAQAQFRPVTHPRAQFQPFANYPAQAQFQPLGHYPAQAQHLAHPQVQFQPFAHYPAQAQFHPWAHPQAQLQPVAYPQPQFQPSVPSQAQFLPFAHPQAQLQPVAHPQPQFEPSVPSQAQFLPFAHSPAQTQFQTAHSYRTGAEVHYQAHVEDQVQPQTQAQAPFGTNNYYHYY